MSLTDNGPTQVPADTIHKAHGVLLCQRHSFIHSALDDRPFCSHPSLHSEPVNNTLLVPYFFDAHHLLRNRSLC
ncbi:hypothetical protein FPSE5266_07718 [Fusarium pseudograminearum]|nr:hypothetical protein FPSE5266_07718 [Fusarium pseudograminearum]